MMYCPNCQDQNEKDALFCKNCGAELYLPQQETNDNTSSILLIIYLAIIMFGGIAQQLMTTLVDDWYQTPVSFVDYVIGFISSACIILPALAIKNTTLRLIGIIMSSLLIVMSVYNYVGVFRW